MMYKYLLFNATILTLIISLTSCSSKKDIVMAEFDGGKITLAEYEEVYSKNNGGYDLAKKDSLQKKKNFLDLYVNFKMKIKDAKERNIDQQPEVQAEIIDYKNKIGVSYLLEKELVEPNIKQLYEKRKEELRVSHIMFRPDSTGDEGALKKATAVLDSIKAGASFEDMAKKYSADYYSAPNGGDIYYITAGDIIPVFEDACYKLKKGEIFPEPVKTQFGYHLIKVTDRQPRTPEIRASHILIEVKPDATKEDSVKAWEMINSIYDKIKQGQDFAELAKEFSEDPGSKTTGGDLGYFSRRMMVQQFDEAAFKLGVNEVSPIVTSQFGYHVIKVTDRKSIKPFDEEKETLKGIYQRIKYNQDYAAFVDSLRKAFNYTYNKAIGDSVEKYADTTEVGGSYWLSDLRKKFGNSVVFTYSDKEIILDSMMITAETIGDFINRRINKPLFESMVSKVSENKILEQAVDTLLVKYPQFASLMDEYKNGILIFKLQEEEVWNKVELTEEKLKNYYEETKEKYQWPDRVEFSEIYVKTDSISKVVYDLLKSGEVFDSVAAKYTERPGFKEKAGYHGIKPVSENQLSLRADMLEEGKYSEPFSHSNGFSIVKLIKKHPAAQKTFEEAQPEVSGGLQEIESKRLEQAYIDYLKTKYKPKIYYEKIEKAFTD